MEIQDHREAARIFAETCGKLGLAVSCTFVPFSQSRNAKEKSPSLNWRCAVTREGRPITGLEAVDYMQGSGLCPASKAGAKLFPVKSDLAQAIALECDKGRRAKPDFGGRPYESRDPIAPPTVVDVLSALCMDSDVIDYPRFEDWAENLGFDPDSRSAEKTYRECLETALVLRAAIGDAALSELREIANQV